MIKDIFPRCYQRYLSLPLLGSILDDFADFLTKLEYPARSVYRRMWAIPAIERRLKQLGCCSTQAITRKKLLDCLPPPRHAKDDDNVSATVHLLDKFFHEKNVFHEPKKNLLEQKIFNYSSYLEKTRGFSQSTIDLHCFTISQFLAYLKKRRKFPKLKNLKSRDIEGFLFETSKRVGRGFLQHVVAHLRSFLRFLTMLDEIPLDLGNQIDTPRAYREEKLPCAVSWNIVKMLLKSVDRSTAIGKRDYAILLLITTYGLRTSEIVSLKLDDIDWQANVLKVFQRKTNNTILLPLTTAVGTSIIDYLKNGRPPVIYREIFIRHNIPNGVLKAGSIGNILSRWDRHNDLLIQIKNPNCLRHSYAVHLLQQGTALKTIGDILGHKSFESTCVYLRLNFNDLRRVPLSFPTASI